MEKPEERQCPNFNPERGHNGICMPNLNPASERWPNLYDIQKYCRGRFEECDNYKTLFPNKQAREIVVDQQLDKNNKQCKIYTLNYSLCNKSKCELSQPAVKVDWRKYEREKNPRTHGGDLLGPGKHGDVIHRIPIWNWGCTRTCSCPRHCLHRVKEVAHKRKYSSHNRTIRAFDQAMCSAARSTSCCGDHHSPAPPMGLAPTPPSCLPPQRGRPFLKTHIQDLRKSHPGMRLPITPENDLLNNN